VSSWIPASRLRFGSLINFIDGPSDHDLAFLQHNINDHASGVAPPVTQVITSTGGHLQHTNNHASTLDAELLDLLDFVGPSPNNKVPVTEYQAPEPTNHIIQLPLDNFTEETIFNAKPHPEQQDDLLKSASFNTSINNDSSSLVPEFSMEIMEPIPSSSGTQTLKRALQEDCQDVFSCKKVKLSNSERCKKNREKKKEDLKAEEDEAKQLELTNECLKVKLAEMEEKVVKYRKIRDLIVFQARAGLTLTPAQHQRINNKVQEAIININFGF